jgi:spore germination cell wall hydrolase CwlJ-like protein
MEATNMSAINKGWLNITTNKNPKIFSLTEQQISCYSRFGGLLAGLFLVIIVPVYNQIHFQKVLKEQQEMHEKYVQQTALVIDGLSDRVSFLSSKYQKTESFKKEATCLAKNIYYEIGTQSKEGMLAVAQVTLNRKREGFANSICNVVYQRTETVCQFSWVCEPHKEPSPSSFNKAYEIAKKSLTNGIAMSKLYTALYFHTEAVKPKWEDEKDFIAQIGPHKFYSEKKIGN